MNVDAVFPFRTALLLGLLISTLHVGQMPTVQAQTATAPPSDNPTKISLEMPASLFIEGENQGYYLDRGKWLAINPAQRKKASVARTFPYPTGLYHVTLQTVGENDGKSTYWITADGERIGDYTNSLSRSTYEEGESFHHTWKEVRVTEGAIIKVGSEVGSNDGKEFSRARWGAVVFIPADEDTRAAAIPVFKEQLAQQKVASRRKTAKATSGAPTIPVSNQPLQMPRADDGDGSVAIGGELKTWHKVVIDLSGPYAHEKDNAPNPFTDYRMTATFRHEDGTQYVIPGFFAADGDAANSHAESGTVWRALFAPDRPGQWSYELTILRGKHVALDDDAEGESVYGTKTGTFEVAATDKTRRDFRGQGRLDYVGKHYLQFAGSKRYFLKVGADAPETLLAFADFDNTIAGNAKKAPIKKWQPHVQDWRDGDPTWAGGKGKGLVGAIRYLSQKGCNAFSFLTYNAGGDGDNVWPFIHRDDKMHYDCSKLDQWGIVFDHGTALGMYLHFKMQETENDDHKKGKGGGFVPTSLDGGNLGPQRKLYCRELIARFGHNLALNWNIGEENTQSTEQQKAMIDRIAELDAYNHPIVIHTFPNQQDQVYKPLLGDRSKLTGASLQNSSLETTHAQTWKWVKASDEAGKPWVVAFDESGSAAHAQCPDLGYKGFDGHDKSGKMTYTQHKVRKQTLWGNLMAGGAGCEYYFGYSYAENDIVCEDWRSRDQSWDYCRIAIGFFHENNVPFWEMENMDQLVGNSKRSVSKFCLAKPGEIYLVYLPNGGTTELDLSGADGSYTVKWFNPRSGGSLSSGSVSSVKGGAKVSLGNAPEDADEDWLVVVSKN